MKNSSFIHCTLYISGLKPGRGVFLKEKCPVSSCVISSNRELYRHKYTAPMENSSLFTLQPLYFRPKAGSRRVSKGKVSCLLLCYFIKQSCTYTSIPLLWKIRPFLHCNLYISGLKLGRGVFLKEKCPVSSCVISTELYRHKYTAPMDDSSFIQCTLYIFQV